MTPSGYIDIADDGSITTLADPSKEGWLAEAGSLITRRYSVIVPEHRGKRIAFRILRRVFGDRGIVASFTRRWRGPWRCIIIDAGVWRVFNRRADALTWERDCYEHTTENRTT